MSYHIIIDYIPLLSAFPRLASAPCGSDTIIITIKIITIRRRMIIIIIIIIIIIVTSNNNIIIIIIII